MSELTREIPSSGQLENWLFEGQSAFDWRRLTGLDALAKALIVASLGQRQKNPILVVFPEKADARNAVDNLQYFLGKEGARRVHYIAPVDFDYIRGVFPDMEALAGRNVGLFHALNDGEKRIFVTTAKAMLQKMMTPEVFLQGTQILAMDEEVDRDALAVSLLSSGYQRQPIAFDSGSFSIRGGVVDVFSPLYTNPIRIELFGDLVEQIRFYDPQSQRSLDPVERAFLIPMGFSLVPRNEDFEEAAEKIKIRLDSQGIPKAKREEVLEKILEGKVGGQISYLFPLLCNGSATLLDYFSKDVTLFWDGKEKILDTVENQDLPRLEENYRLFESENVPIAAKDQLFVSWKEFQTFLNSEKHVFFQDFKAREDDTAVTLNSDLLSLERERQDSRKKQSGHPVLESFSKRFKSWMEEGYRIQVVCHTQTHAERIQFLFESYGIRSRFVPEGTASFPAMLKTEASFLNLWQGFITQSAIYSGLKIIIISEEEIFGHKKRAPKSVSSGADVARTLNAFRDLKTGDFIVHKDHGIGKYLGLKSMSFQGIRGDYVLIKYRDGDKLYVPVYRLNAIQKYVGGEEGSPVLDKLGGERWARARKKAERAVAELAAEFLETQAKRKLIPAPPLSKLGADYHEFEMEFPFDETPDQLKSIEAVMDDMSQSHPMDRLVVGDVGYGKTEVAMRAAYRCALDGKQVAMLVPTTILAFQHFENFKERFKSTAVRIEMVSRLRSTAQNRATLALLKEGKVDIIIGTHRLLSSDVTYRDLALLVIDEEHRFGVVHKEKLKKICESVHLLSMTATPIPRTLNMAMTGIKEISLITTPPPDRLSIRTFVCRRSSEVIAEAISNEIARGGQVFFMHNRIETIQKVYEEIKELFPNVKVEIVHGQMEPAKLEKKMLAFYQNEFHVLLTTTIIESGLDIPRVNTILLDKAHTLGLAQMYQLRGRVGRSDRRAYCYLLVPSETEMTEEAKRRLQVIQRHTGLGSGFNIASHDLEIRGAGDLLGKSQSGHINAIGVDLYFELLDESVRYLSGEKKKIEIEPEINLRMPAFFPNDYLPDVGERIILYRRLSAVEDEEGISETEEEIRDRFGGLPEEVINLLGLMKIKLYLKRMHVTHMNCGPKRASLQFASSTPIAPDRMVQLVQSAPKRYSLTPDHKLVFEVGNTDWRDLLQEVHRLAEALGA